MGRDFTVLAAKAKKQTQILPLRESDDTTKKARAKDKDPTNKSVRPQMPFEDATENKSKSKAMRGLPLRGRDGRMARRFGSR